MCDWFYNVDCGQAKNFADYSNSRLYQGPEVHLLDDQNVESASESLQSPNEPLVKAPKKTKSEQQIQLASAVDGGSSDYQLKPVVHKRKNHETTTAASSGYMPEAKVKLSQRKRKSW